MANSRAGSPGLEDSRVKFMLGRWWRNQYQILELQIRRIRIRAEDDPGPQHELLAYIRHLSQVNGPT